MAWTTPKTFTAGSVLTAAELNTHLRDNLNETSAATVTTAGDMTYADAANSMGNRLAIGAAGELMISNGSVPQWRSIGRDEANNTQTSATTTTYQALDGASWGGTAVSVTVTTGTKALVGWAAHMWNDTAGESTWLAMDISGATTEGANDNQALMFESESTGHAGIIGRTRMWTNLTAGSNTFEMFGRASGPSGIATVRRTKMWVLPL